MLTGRQLMSSFSWIANSARSTPSTNRGNTRTKQRPNVYNANGRTKPHLRGQFNDRTRPVGKKPELCSHFHRDLRAYSRTIKYTTIAKFNSVTTTPVAVTR